METKLRYLLLPLIAFFTINIGAAQAQISGTFTYLDEWPMDNCTVYLMDSTGTIIDSTQTNGAGEYAFYGIVPGDYSITGSTIMSAGGVDLADSFILLLYLFNWYSFTPMQELAADVDANNSIDWADYFTILNGWITQGYPFPAGEWVFDTTFITISSTRDNVTGNGQGASTGDINGTWEPDKIFNAHNIDYIAATGTIQKNREITYPIAIRNNGNLSGFHLDLGLPEGLTFTGYESEMGLFTNQTEDVLKLTWMNQSMETSSTELNIQLKFSVNADFDSNTELDLDVLGGSHFINNQGEYLFDFTMEMARITFTSNQAEENDLIVSTGNFPNPIVTITTFAYEISEPGEISLMIFNSSGQVVKMIEMGNQASGYHNLTLNIGNYPAGVYQYRLVFKGRKEAISRDRKSVV